MLEYNIRIIVIKSSSLRAEGDIGTLIKFAEVMRKMNHLEEFDFDCEDFEVENAPPMELLADLPFKFLKSYQFKIFEKGDVVRMAKTLSLIKSLCGPNSKYYRRGFHLIRSYVSDYRLTLEDFELLKNLPVTSVDLEALDLKQDNITDFREIMNEMKIRDIYFYDELFPDFEIYVDDFGPGGIYKTINVKTCL